MLWRNDDVVAVRTFAFDDPIFFRDALLDSTQGIEKGLRAAHDLHHIDVWLRISHHQFDKSVDGKRMQIDMPSIAILLSHPSKQYISILVFC